MKAFLAATDVEAEEGEKRGRTMAGEAKTVTGALNNYFSVVGDTGSLSDGTYGKSAKRAASEFLDELKALSTEEKLELAKGVCGVTGWTLKTS
jgi:hypothetical protein